MVFHSQGMPLFSINRMPVKRIGQPVARRNLVVSRIRQPHRQLRDLVCSLRGDDAKLGSLARGGRFHNMFSTITSLTSSLGTILDMTTVGMSRDGQAKHQFLIAQKVLAM